MGCGTNSPAALERFIDIKHGGQKVKRGFNYENNGCYSEL